MHEEKISYEKMMSPASLNVILPRYKRERLKLLKDRMFLNWEEFIGDYFYELLDAIYNGIHKGIRYENHSEALSKVVNEWGRHSNKRMYEKGYLSKAEAKKLGLIE